MGTVTESDGTAFSVIPTTDDDIGCVMALDKIMCKQMNSMAQGGETEALEIEPMDRLFLEQRIGSRRKARKNWHSLKCSSNVDGSAAGIVICSHEILRNKRKRGTRPKRTKYLEIFWIAVCPGLQGKGCGQTLLTKCIEYAQNRDADLREVRLHVHVGNKRAINFYKKMGFSITATKRGYFPGHTVYRMVKSL
eukprot:INCI17526.1.p1 GENE.INCI17526.1~~INCI17526.1.p1  ORF type:complete len:193 (-),score=29.58 INCI17526.1:456-1034(-)